MNESKKFESIPAQACVFSAAEVQFGDNGTDAKTTPIKLLARSAKPIEHWFWGKVVHDIAGMTLHKQRIPIDYAHQDSEVLGYLNKFENTPDGLLTSGALTPYKDGDRASEVIFKQRAGVPYEASINFGGDGIKVQELAQGELAEVNGYQFEGPGVIIRSWPLRGVAVCPYGADANTASNVFSSSSNFRAESIQKNSQTEENQMAENKEAVESAAVEAAPEAAVIAPKTEEPKTVEAAPVAAEVLSQESKMFSVEELGKIAAEFGAEIAVKAIISGEGRAGAQSLKLAQLDAENKKLKEHLATIPTNPEKPAGANPVSFMEADIKGKAKLRDLFSKK